jgi:hypothetical protein
MMIAERYLKAFYVPAASAASPSGVAPLPNESVANGVLQNAVGTVDPEEDDLFDDDDYGDDDDWDDAMIGGVCGNPDCPCAQECSEEEDEYEWNADNDVCGDPECGICYPKTERVSSTTGTVYSQAVQAIKHIDAPEVKVSVNGEFLGTLTEITYHRPAKEGVAKNGIRNFEPGDTVFMDIKLADPN